MHMKNENLSFLKLRGKDPPLIELFRLKFSKHKIQNYYPFVLGEGCCSVEFRDIHKTYPDMEGPVVFALERIHILITNAI